MFISYLIGFCLHDTVSPCIRIVSLMHPNEREAQSIDNEVPLTELTPDSTFYTILDLIHATFRAFSFENTKW